MTINADLQKLEPGAKLEFYDFDMTSFGGEILYFHGMNDGPITWDGQEYTPWPIHAQGFARTGSQPPRPTLGVGNTNGSITALCIAYDDLLGAVLTRRTTLLQYLDAVNFDGGNPTADPTQEFPPEIWYVDRKASENYKEVIFELASAMDFQNVQLPRRQILANHCWWKGCGGYRGEYCGYSGGPVATVNDVPTADPLLDMCSGSVAGCKLRYGEFGKLPYGSFPAAGLIRL